MGYRQTSFPMTKVVLDGHYYVNITPLTKGEDDDADVALVGGVLEGNVAGAAVQAIKAKLSQRDYTDTVLLRAIKEWNLDDDGGNVLPITLENIRNLRDDHADTIYLALRQLNNPLADKKVRRD